MKTKLVKAFSAVALASTLVACGKTKTVKEEWTDEEKLQWATENGLAPEMTQAEKDAWATQNGYVKDPANNGYVAEDDLADWAEENGYVIPEEEKEKLEVTFNNYEDVTKNLTAIGYADLALKFENEYDFIVMLGNSTCSTCATLKNYMGTWVGDTKYTVYYISDETADDAKKTEVMTKLGNPTTWPKLYAVVDGEVEDILSFGGSEEVTDAKVKPFIKKYFEMETFTAETYRFESLAEYRAAVASGEQFIVYVGRDACPDCKNLSDIQKDDSLRKYFTEYTGKIYSIVSEDTIAEHAESTLWNDVTKWNGYWGNIKAVNGVLTSSVSGNNKAENLAYMIAGGVFDKDTLELGQEEFLAAAIAYANNAYLNDDGTNYMRDSIRSVPGLAAVNFDHSVEYAQVYEDDPATEANEAKTDAVFQLIADNAEIGTKEVNGKTYRTIQTTKMIQVWNAELNEGQGGWEEKENTYTRYMIKGSGVPSAGANAVALWVTHKNAFVGALGGKGAASFGTYTNNLTFSNIYTDCLTSRSAVYHTQYELEYVQAQTMNWMTSWVYTTAE